MPRQWAEKSVLHEPIRMPRPIKPPFRRNVERLLRHNKLFHSFWITPRRGETLRVSTRQRPSDVWALAGALTSRIRLHVLRFSNTFTREKNREDRSRSMVGDMIP